MNCERKRLESFKDWPVSHKSPILLAKDGFYYVGSRFPEAYDCLIGFNDAVRCHFCSGILYQWTFTDSIRQEHKRNFPYCAFIKGLATTNIPLIVSTESTDSDFVTFRVKKSVIEKVLEVVLSHVENSNIQP